MAEILFKQESFEIIGACFEVFNDKGSGFLEPVYHDCLKIELGLRGIPFISKPQLELSYKGHILESKYEPDLVCFEKIIIELKAVTDLVNEHRAQLHNYLKGTGFRLGLLVNFGSRGQLEHERIVR